MTQMSEPIALRRRRDYAGPALFSYGFRPFFLGAALWAGLAVTLWLAQYDGALALPSALGPLDWHVHEMIYGYGSAVIAGFLLTAIPNWTGRLPVNGLPLAALALVWLAGRLAIAISAEIGLATAAVIDVGFLTALAMVALREIVAGKNWRNLRVLVVIGALIAGNIIFFVEVATIGGAKYGIRTGVAAVVLLITLIGGRIVPSFTRNWLVRVNPGRLPTPFARFDMVSLGVSALALLSWAIRPEHVVVGLLLLLAGAVQIVRLTRWAGYRTFSDRLVLVLHVGYAFVPIGFLLMGTAILWPNVVPPSAGWHAWGVGAIGLMTVAVMTRATLGHNGRVLMASTATQMIYAGILIAALFRIAASLSPSLTLLLIAAVAWVASFLGFVVVYGPMLALRPPSWQGRS